MRPVLEEACLLLLGLAFVVGAIGFWAFVSRGVARKSSPDGSRSSPRGASGIWPSRAGRSR